MQDTPQAITIDIDQPSHYVKPRKECSEPASRAMEKMREYKKGKNKIFLENDKKKMIAEVDFPHINPNTVVITHTFVDNSLRGQGIASELIEQVYDHAKENGKVIKATCPYAVKWFDDHPENCDILIK